MLTPVRNGIGQALGRSDSSLPPGPGYKCDGLGSRRQLVARGAEQKIQKHLVLQEEDHSPTVWKISLMKISGAVALYGALTMSITFSACMATFKLEFKCLKTIVF